MDAPPELELLASARRGDSAAFERGWWRATGARCTRTATYRMVGSVQDAEDALQESFLGA